MAPTTWLERFLELPVEPNWAQALQLGYLGLSALAPSIFPLEESLHMELISCNYEPIVPHVVLYAFRIRSEVLSALDKPQQRTFDLITRPRQCFAALVSPSPSLSPQSSLYTHLSYI